MPKPIKSIAMSAPVEITAGEMQGEKPGPAKFTSTIYTGGELNIEGWDLPVVVDLAGLDRGKVLVANLDHDKTKRVGNFDVANDGRTLIARGTATAKTPARDEVVGSAQDGYQWQSSIEANPSKVEEVKAGKKVHINGQEFTGPLYVARKATLKGFGFVSHGADDNTTVTIAASAASNKEKNMKAEVQAWIEKDFPSVSIEAMSAEEVANWEANYAGRNGKKPTIKADSSNPFEARKIEAKRRNEIRQVADARVGLRENDEEWIDAIEKLHDHAIAAGMSVQEFKNELYEATVPLAHTVRSSPKSRGVDANVIEAALCVSLRLPNVEKLYNDQTLQAAHDRFKNGIGLKQLLFMGAESHGHNTGHSSDYSRDILEAAFPERKNRTIKAQGWSTIEVSSILSNVAGKFLREGFMAVEDTWSRISTIRPVRDFKQITTVSLVGDLSFEKLGAAGEIKHGTLGEVVYTGKADTYAKMLAITRQDIINDDIGALAAAPRRLGRGAATKLNDIFWTAFLYGETAGFFSGTHTTAGDTGNSNLNSGAADATIAGLTATELLFLNQVDPNGLPLGVMPRIVLVPNAIKAAMAALLDPQSKLITGSDVTKSNVNVFAGRFRLESSSYLHNTAYTGYSSSAWYMLADPNELSAIEIQALNGRVEPTVESADADFNTLGIQIRAYGDVGVSRQEYRAAVKADGGAS